MSIRLRLLWQRRQLATLETKLGLLGWQQADYDSGTQHHVDQINEFERAQGELTNESASLGLTLQQLEERRAAERTAFESQRADRIAARDPLAAPAEEAENALQAKRREHKELGERIVALEHEATANEEKYRALLAKGNHTSSQEAEVQRLQHRAIAIPQEKRQCETDLVAAEKEIPRLETEAHQRRAMHSVENEALQALERDFAKNDAALAAEIAERQRDKQKLEKRIEGIEKSKTQPYREIGRALADHQIEPLNQPQALAAVLEQREQIAARETRLAASLEQTHREKRTEIWGSWALLLTLAVLILGAVWIAMKGR